jgi:hypothetical protein
MINPRYQVTISYVPTYRTGRTGTYVTQSNGSSLLVSTVDTYGGGHFQASMPEILIFATGSSYATALTNLLNIATASTTLDNGLPPLGS